MSNGSIGAIDAIEQVLAGNPARRRPSNARAGAKLAAKSRVTLQQEPWRERLLAEAPRRFAVAGGGEIEQGQPLEQHGVGHVRVQRRDQLFGRVELILGLARIGLQRRLPLWPLGGFLKQREQSDHAEQGQREAGREQRIDHSRCRREERPSSAAHSISPEGQARRVDERAQHPRAAELLRDCRER